MTQLMIWKTDARELKQLIPLESDARELMVWELGSWQAQRGVNFWEWNQETDSLKLTTKTSFALTSSFPQISPASSLRTSLLSLSLLSPFSGATAS
tara:strand:- start:222 stop:509 length:288 start_codon:yes stop_codon:yes gene_type:complete